MVGQSFLPHSSGYSKFVALNLMAELDQFFQPLQAAVIDLPFQCTWLGVSAQANLFVFWCEATQKVYMGMGEHSDTEIFIELDLTYSFFAGQQNQFALFNRLRPRRTRQGIMIREEPKGYDLLFQPDRSVKLELYSSFLYASILIPPTWVPVHQNLHQRREQVQIVVPAQILFIEYDLLSKIGPKVMRSGQKDLACCISASKNLGHIIFRSNNITMICHSNPRNCSFALHAWSAGKLMTIVNWSASMNLTRSLSKYHTTKNSTANRRLIWEEKSKYLIWQEQAHYKARLGNWTVKIAFKK